MGSGEKQALFYSDPMSKLKLPSFGMKEIPSGTLGSHTKNQYLKALLQESFFTKSNIKWWCFSFLLPTWNLREDPCLSINNNLL